MKTNVLLSCALVVLGVSDLRQAHAQAPSTPPGLAVDAKTLSKGIDINVILPPRTELYCGNATGPTKPLTGQRLPRKVKLSIPFLQIKNSELDLAQSNETPAKLSDLDQAIKSSFEALQQSILQVEDGVNLSSSLVPRYDENDKEKILSKTFNRAELDYLESFEKSAIRTALDSGLAEYAKYLNGLIDPLGYKLDLNQIGILDSRKYDLSKVETPGELDDIVGVLYKGEKTPDCDDTQWRLNFSPYTIHIKILIVKK